MLDIKQYFEALRFDERHHLGLGDIRLTRSQQEEIEKLFDDLESEIDALRQEREAIALLFRD